MSSKGCRISELFLILTIVLTWGETRAQSSCTGVLITMTSCVNYITGNSSTPTPSCCSALADVAKTQPECLCVALTGNSVASLGVAMNRTHVADLPRSCNVKTPPLSECNENAAAPTVLPTVDLPSGIEPKTTPGTVSDGTTADGTTLKSSLQLLAMAVSCTSFLTIF